MPRTSDIRPVSGLYIRTVYHEYTAAIPLPRNWRGQDHGHTGVAISRSFLLAEAVI